MHQLKLNMNKKILIIFVFFVSFLFNSAVAAEPKSIGKYKNWETFRKSEKIKNEISITSGHEYKTSSVKAKSGRNEFSFFSQGNFAWLLDGEEEFNLIKTMKKASKLAVTATAKNGSQTKDLYSMMGFTKAYNAARKSCA